MLKFLPFIPFGLICQITFAQIRVEAKAGASLCNTHKLTNDPYYEPFYRIGWYAGVKTVIPLSEKLALQPELLISSKGFSYNSNPAGETYNVRVRFNYLVMPILLTYKVAKPLSVGIGPELGYLVNVNQRFPSKAISNLTRHYSIKFDMGLNAHVGYQINRAFNIEMRYNYGFRTFYYINSQGNRIGESLGANRGIQLGLSYLLTKDLWKKIIKIVTIQAKAMIGEPCTAALKACIIEIPCFFMVAI